jgi:hypothetical protein
MKKLIPANGTASGARCKTKRISTKREASMKARAFFHLRGGPLDVGRNKNASSGRAQHQRAGWVARGRLGKGGVAGVELLRILPKPGREVPAWSCKS